MHNTVGRKTNDFVTLQSFFHCAEGGGNISLWGTKPVFHKVAKMKHQIIVSEDEMICLHNELQNPSHWIVLNEGSMIWDWPGG